MERYLFKVCFFIIIMVNNKTEKEKGKKEPEYRTKEERQKEVKHILEQLSEFQLNINYEPVKVICFI